MKWRRLPWHVQEEELPSPFFCALNTCVPCFLVESIWMVWLVIADPRIYIFHRTQACDAAALIHTPHDIMPYVYAQVAPHRGLVRRAGGALGRGRGTGLGGKERLTIPTAPFTAPDPRSQNPHTHFFPHPPNRPRKTHPKPNKAFTRPPLPPIPQEATLKFNVDFTGLQVGDWVDVRCERNNVWYEARVILREGDQVKARKIVCV